VRALREQQLVTNDPASGVFGQFDPKRMQDIVSRFGRILQAQGTVSQVPSPDALYTNEFIDPSIRMG
jgi:hypothetical protein